MARKFGFTSEEEVRALSDFVRQRSTDYKLSMDKEGNWYSGDSDEPTSIKKLTKVLAEDAVAAKVTKIRGKNLTSFIAIAIRVTREALLKNEYQDLFNSTLKENTCSGVEKNGQHCNDSSRVPNL